MSFEALNVCPKHAYKIFSLIIQLNFVKLNTVEKFGSDQSYFVKQLFIPQNINLKLDFYSSLCFYLCLKLLYLLWFLTVVKVRDE